MDDRDEGNARRWLNLVEGDKSFVRDQDIYPQLRAWVDQISPREILEIGCGQGVCSEKIDLVGRHYTGVEPSALLLARANELYGAGNRKFESGSAEILPYPDASFDAAFSVSVWHLLEDLTQVSKELSRVLKLSGNFLIITANPEAYSLWQETYAEIKIQGRLLEGKVSLPDHSTVSELFHLHTFKEIENSLGEAGLLIQQRKTFRTSIHDLDYFVFIEGQKFR